MNRRRFITAVSVLSTGVLSGCTGDGGGEPGGQATPTPTAQPPGTTTGTPSVGQQEFPDYNWEVLDGADASFTTEITLRNTQFHPIIAKVPVGESISFSNEDAFDHTVTIPALDTDERVGGGESTTLTFDELTALDYVCTLHPPSMLGRLIVTDETPSGTSTKTPTPTETDNGGGGEYY